MFKATEDRSDEKGGEMFPHKEASGPSLISVAFVTAMICGPVVIATGLLTTHSRPTAEVLTDISPAAFRPSDDATMSPPMPTAMRPPLPSR